MSNWSAARIRVSQILVLLSTCCIEENSSNQPFLLKMEKWLRERQLEWRNNYPEVGLFKNKFTQTELTEALVEKGNRFPLSSPLCRGWRLLQPSHTAEWTRAVLLQEAQTSSCHLQVSFKMLLNSFTLWLGLLAEKIKGWRYWLPCMNMKRSHCFLPKAQQGLSHTAPSGLPWCI